MPRSLLRQAALIAFALTLSGWMAPASHAQDSATQRLSGQITRIDGDMLYLRTTNGQPATVLLAPDASVTSVKPAKETECHGHCYAKPR
jgi:hypothetical protein